MRKPGGEAGPPASDRLHVLVQRHEATRLQHGLRLAWDGVSTSRAMAKGLPTVPHNHGGCGSTSREHHGGGTAQPWDRDCRAAYCAAERAPAHAVRRLAA